VVDHLFSGLVTWTPDLSVEPDVARTWEVLDGGRRYVFHLRDDVLWSDGVPVTAADFEYAWKRVLDPATDSPVAGLLYDIRAAQQYHQGKLASADHVGVRAQDEWTLVVELEGPTAYFLQLLTHSLAFPVPRHIVQLLGDDWLGPERIVTNGPFRLAKWDRDRTIVLERSPTYHGPFPGNVRRVVITAWDAPSQLKAYEQDALDLVDLLPLLPPAEADMVRRRHADEYISMPVPETWYVGFDAGRPPFDDRRVRRAFALATDRGQLADTVQRGLEFPATGGLVPPGMPGHSPRIGLPYDPQQARLLLAEAGFPGGRAFPDVEFLVPQSPGNLPTLEYLQSAWMEDLGVRVEWTRLEWGALLDRLYERPPHLWLVGWWADYADPDNFLRAASWIHQTGWRDQSYDELINSARRVLDPERRFEMYRQADKILVEEAPVLPLTYGRTRLLAKPWVSFPPLGLGVWHYKDFTIEPH
jgi:oligopeptide transport system substrate-binding protein